METEKQLYGSEKKAMNDTDRIAIGNELATVERQLIAVKEEKSNVNKKYRVRINDLEEKTDALSKQLADDVAVVRFEVEEVPDDARGYIQVLRKGTNELVNSRPMTEVEKEAMRKRKQIDLFDENGDPKDKPGGTVTSMRPRKNGKGKKK